MHRCYRRCMHRCYHGRCHPCMHHDRERASTRPQNQAPADSRFTNGTCFLRPGRVQRGTSVMGQLQAFDHVGITVADLDTATAFFVGLGLEVEGRPTNSGCAASPSKSTTFELRSIGLPPTVTASSAVSVNTRTPGSWPTYAVRKGSSWPSPSASAERHFRRSGLAATRCSNAKGTRSSQMNGVFRLRCSRTAR